MIFIFETGINKLRKLFIIIIIVLDLCYEESDFLDD